MAGEPWWAAGLRGGWEETLQVSPAILDGRDWRDPFLRTHKDLKSGAGCRRTLEGCRSWKLANSPLINSLNFLSLSRPSFTCLEPAWWVVLRISTTVSFPFLAFCRVYIKLRKRGCILGVIKSIDLCSTILEVQLVPPFFQLSFLYANCLQISDSCGCYIYIYSKLRVFMG